MKVRIIIFTALLALFAIPASAEALHGPPAGTLSRIDGATAYAQDQTGLAVRDLRTGAAQHFSLPDNYAVWNDTPVAAHGRFAGVTDEGGTARVFVTGPDGINYLSSWSSDSSECSRRQVPLGITAGGSVTILELAKVRGPGGHGCIVDTAKTHLRLHSLAGTVRELWLPTSFAKWLAYGGTSLRGNQLLISRPASKTNGGAFVVLNLSTKQLVRRVDAGRSFTGAELTARDGALARYQHGAKVAARHFSFYLERSKLIYRGTNARFVACGQRTAVLRVGSFTLVGFRGNRLFHTARTGDYDYSSAVCSDQIAHYALEPDVPAMGEVPDLPPRIARTLDLSLFTA